MNHERKQPPPRRGQPEDDTMDGSMFPSGRDGPLSPGDDAWIESLLREDAARQPHIADDGFVVRVLMNMPAPRKPAPRWIVPAATAAGCAIADRSPLRVSTRSSAAPACTPTPRARTTWRRKSSTTRRRSPGRPREDHRGDAATPTAAARSTDDGRGMPVDIHPRRKSPASS
jgi:hypothetical protein